jgi:hypothetical protein
MCNLDNTWYMKALGFCQDRLFIAINPVYAIVAAAKPLKSLIVSCRSVDFRLI